MQESVEFIVEPFKYNVKYVSGLVNIEIIHMDEYHVWSTMIHENINEANEKIFNINLTPEVLFKIIQDYHNKTLDESVNITFPTKYKTFDSQLSLVIDFKYKYGEKDTKYINLDPKKISFEEKLNYKIDKLKEDFNKYKSQNDKNDFLSKETNNKLSQVESDIAKTEYNMEEIVYGVEELDDKIKKMEKTINDLQVNNKSIKKSVTALEKKFDNRVEDIKRGLFLKFHSELRRMKLQLGGIINNQSSENNNKKLKNKDYCDDDTDCDDCYDECDDDSNCDTSNDTDDEREDDNDTDCNDNTNDEVVHIMDILNKQKKYSEDELKTLLSCENIGNLDEARLLSSLSTEQEFDSVFETLNTLFLSMTDSMKSILEKRDYVVGLMKVIHFKNLNKKDENYENNTKDKKNNIDEILKLINNDIFKLKSDSEILNDCNRDDFENIFSSLNQLFLDLTCKVNGVNSKRDKVIEFLKIIHNEAQRKYA